MKRTIITVVALAALAAPAVQAAKPEPRNITISATPTTVKFGGAVTLSGKLNGSNNANRPITVEENPFPFDDNAFTPSGPAATTNAQGEWTFSDKPTVNTRYRARSGNAESRTIDVGVRPAISLALSDYTPRVGQVVRFFGRFCPERDGTRVGLQRRVAPNQWRTLRRPMLTDIPGETCSSYSKRLAVRRDGRYRVHFFGTGDLTEGNSRSRFANAHL
jgi:hypothetical protein